MHNYKEYIKFFVFFTSGIDSGHPYINDCAFLEGILQ